MISARFENDGIISLKLNQLQLSTRMQVIKKLSELAYTTEHVACLCGATADEVLAKKDRYGLPVVTVICTCCGLLRTTPRMNEISLHQFYEHDYRKLYVGEEKATENFFSIQYAHGKRIVDFLLQRTSIPENASVLEIGCGAGGILKAFAELNYRVKGIDLGSEYIGYGQQQGLDLEKMSSAKLVETGKKYDVVILSHVMEHFLDIRQELDIIDKLLLETGMLYIEVPGLLNLHHTYEADFLLYLQNAHNYHFTLVTLTKVLNESGFRLVSGDEFIRSLFVKDQAVTVNSESNQSVSQSIIEYLTDLEINREHYRQQLALQKVAQRKFLFEQVGMQLNDYPDNSIYVYGTGQHTKILLEVIGPSKAIAGLLDADHTKTGANFFGLTVADLELVRPSIKAIVISSDLFQDIIYDRLKYLIEDGIQLIKIYPVENGPN